MKVADVVVTDDALGTNVLSLSGADAALFEIDGGVLYLKAGAVLDFETNPQLDVTVAVDDATVGTTPDGTAALSIAVTDVNEPPTVSLTNTVTTLAEDTDTATRVKVADVVVADDALGTNVLSLSGADAALFEIDGGVLYLKAGAVLDFETNPQLDVTVAVDDADGRRDAGRHGGAFHRRDGRERAANGESDQYCNHVARKTPNTTARVKVADIVVTDDALGTNVLSLSGADAALFEIDGGVLYLKAGAVLDYETNPQLDVTVAVDDATVGATPDGTAALSIAVTDVNEPPTVSLTNTVTTLAEDTDTAARVKVADVVVTDDALGTNVLSLSGADAALFEIDGGVLYLKAGAVLDFETSPQLDVTVAVDDPTVGATPDGTAALSIAVTDVNEPPTVSLTNTVTTLAEDTDTATRGEGGRRRGDGRCVGHERLEPQRRGCGPVRDRRRRVVLEGRSRFGLRDEPAIGRDGGGGRRNGRRNAGRHGGAFHRRDGRERASDGESDQHRNHVGGKHEHDAAGEDSRYRGDGRCVGHERLEPQRRGCGPVRDRRRRVVLEGGSGSGLRDEPATGRDGSGGRRNGRRNAGRHGGALHRRDGRERASDGEL